MDGFSPNGKVVAETVDGSFDREAEIYGDYAVVLARNPQHAVVEGIYVVVDVKNGGGISFYDNLDIARRFARTLNKEFPELGAVLDRLWSGTGTALDQAYFDRVKDRRTHDSYHPPSSSLNRHTGRYHKYKG